VTAGRSLFIDSRLAGVKKDCGTACHDDDSRYTDGSREN
jgi:hypothetical protein